MPTRASKAKQHGSNSIGMRPSCVLFAPVHARVRVFFFESIVCHLLGPYKWLERPLISCEWLPVFLLWHLTSSPYRFSALSQFLSPNLFLCRRSPGRLWVIDTYHWPRGSDGAPPLLLPPSLNPLTFFQAGATTLPCRSLGTCVQGEGSYSRADTVSSYRYEHL